MKTIRKLRYYCDFCKKSGGSPFHMRNHEEHCTLNPSRSCRVCGSSSPPEDLDLFVKTLDVNEDDYITHVSDKEDELILRSLYDKSDGCPACILSALRRNETFCASFDYKKAMMKHWSEVNAERRDMIAFDHDY